MSLVLLLQETCLLPREVGTLNKYFKDYNTHGISGKNGTVPPLGLPYGGCSFIYKQSFSAIIEPINNENSRVCCI